MNAINYDAFKLIKTCSAAVQQELEQEYKGRLKTSKTSYQSPVIITTFFPRSISLARSLLN